MEDWKWVYRPMIVYLFNIILLFYVDAANCSTWSLIYLGIWCKVVSKWKNIGICRLFLHNSFFLLLRVCQNAKCAHFSLHHLLRITIVLLRWHVLWFQGTTPWFISLMKLNRLLLHKIWRCVICLSVMWVSIFPSDILSRMWWFLNFIMLNDSSNSQVLFVSERTVIGVGFDCNPMIFAADETGLW